MGTVFDHFENIFYRNEADVNNKFVIPFLTDFLGYSVENDIYAEVNYPAKDFNFGRKSVSTKSIPSHQRPDFVICIDEISNPKFVFESKAPSEGLEDHLKQLKSYTLGVGVNLLVITNGKEFRIYDVNELLFKAENIGELDIRFNHVKKILSKDIHKKKNIRDILRDSDFTPSLGLSAEEIRSEEKAKIRLEISDFCDYLKNLKEEFVNWQIPREFHSLYDVKIMKYPPDKLHRFKIYEHSESKFHEEKDYTFDEISSKFKNIKVLLGESGIGKTTLLKYLCYSKTVSCLNLTSSNIPIYVPLRNIGAKTSLKDSIIESLEKRGYNFSKRNLFEIMSKNSFVFFLDAYDEIQENYQEDVKRQVEEFVSYQKNDVYITSRVSKPLFLPGAIQFIVKPLDEKVIENFVEVYCSSQKTNFLQEIKNKGLVEESKNTLLLTLMIFIYKQDSYVPFTRNQIIKKAIKQIKIWEMNKGERLTESLKWDIKEQLFSKLAFKFFESGKKSYLSIAEIDEALLPLLDAYEQNREIPRGVDKYRILEDLTLTGIINYESNQLSFWHNIFLYYFASKELASLNINSPEFIEEIKEQAIWEYIIIGSSIHMSDSTKLINNLKENNLFLAAACLIESQFVEESTVKNIVSELKDRCFSPLTLIRYKALHYLKKIDSQYTIDLFFALVESETYPDIRMVALEEISKTRTDKAKDVVYKYLEWNATIPFPYYWGTSQGSVAKALSYFDKEEHLKIVNIWREKRDIFSSSNCKEALLDICRNGKLTTKLKEEILKLFLESINPKDEKSGRDLDSEISIILIEINDEDFIPTLIENIDKSYVSIHNMYIEEILASYRSETAINLLINATLNKHNDVKIIEVCSASLSKSKGIVPLNVFIQLLEHDNFTVRAHAINGLSRFSSSEVENYLWEHFNDEDYFVQGNILKVLGDRGLLSALLDRQPFNLYSIDVLLEEIRKFKLKELLPIIKSLKQQAVNDDRVLFDIAHTLCIIDEKEQSKEIVNAYLDDTKVFSRDFVYADLAKIAPNFDETYSIQIINFVLKLLDQSKDRIGYWKELCIESLEKIGNKEATVLLKEIAIDSISKKEVLGAERTLRSLNRLTTNDDEDWYIDFITSNPSLNMMDLRRAIEGLGLIGSEKSIETIKKIAINNKDDSYTCDVCYSSLENIYRNMNVLKDIREEDLFNE